MRAIEITAPARPRCWSLTSGPTRAGGRRAADRACRRRASTGPMCCSARALYPMPPGVSDLPGLEVAGTVAGGDAKAWRRPAWRSATRLRAGRRRRLRRVLRRAGRPVPAGAQGPDDIEAASLPETFFTVWQNVFHIAGLQAGETLLVQGGSSGIGVTAIQLAKALGARVIVTAGSDDKCAACVALGADHAINYKAQDFVAEVKRLTGGRGADVVLDMVAGDYLGARDRVPGRRRPAGGDRGAGRRVERDRRRRAAAQAPGDHRLDAAPALGRLQGGAGARRCATRSGRCSKPGRVKPVDPPGVPGRAGRRRRMR